jgi:hypothetical protein
VLHGFLEVLARVSPRLDYPRNGDLPGRDSGNRLPSAPKPRRYRSPATVTSSPRPSSLPCSLRPSSRHHRRRGQDHHQGQEESTHQSPQSRSSTHTASPFCSSHRRGPGPLRSGLQRKILNRGLWDTRSGLWFQLRKSRFKFPLHKAFARVNAGLSSCYTSFVLLCILFYGPNPTGEWPSLAGKAVPDRLAQPNLHNWRISTQLFDSGHGSGVAPRCWLRVRGHQFRASVRRPSQPTGIAGPTPTRWCRAACW